MAEISIIMPSKNVVNYIDECLNSVRNQTFRDIEILCVDAFSTDGTREVLKKHAQEDSRIRLIDDGTGSTGYAFNQGLKMASGKYIGIVETDDYVNREMFEILYSLAEEYRLDYIKADFNAFMEIKNKRFFIPIPTFYNEDKKYYNRILTLADYQTIRIADGYMWKGIYRKAFLEKNKVRMHETKGAAFQDQGFLYRTVYSAERAMYVNQYLYNYRRDNESSSVYSDNMIKKMMREYQEIEKDIQNGELSIEGKEREYYYEKFARYKGVLINSDETLWENSLKRIREEFYAPFAEGHITRASGYVYKDLVVLMNNISKYICRLKEEQERFYGRIHEIADFVGDNDIIICCAGVISRGVFCLLRRFSKSRIIALADNDRNLWNSELNGVRVIPLNETGAYENCKYIVANERNAPLIYAQLIKQRINYKDIYICDEAIDLNWIMNKNLENLL